MGVKHKKLKLVRSLFISRSIWCIWVHGAMGQCLMYVSVCETVMYVYSVYLKQNIHAALLVVLQAYILVMLLHGLEI